MALVFFIVLLFGAAWMNWLAWLVLVIFLVVIVGVWCLNLIGLPGNWLIVLACLLWLWLGPEQFRFSWWLIVALVGLAAAGETVEFVAAVVGTRKYGGSRTGATCSLIGAMIGGLVGAIVGLPVPIPLIGALIGSILFASGGAWIGAALGERWNGKPWEEALPIGNAAFVGRLLGTVGKFTLGAAMVGLTFLGPFCF